MIVRYKKSVVKNGTFNIASDTDLAKYIVQNQTVYTTSDESVATVSNGVITAVGVGRAVVTAMLGDDGVEINFETIGIDVDYTASGADSNNKISFENQREIKFKITPGYIVRTKLDPITSGGSTDGIEIVQPTDTTVIVKATSSTKKSAKIKLELVDRHSEYVGVIAEVSPTYTNINGETVSATYDHVGPVQKGVKIWDDVNKCYRYIQTEDDPDNPGQKFYNDIPKDATFFYQSVYTSEYIVVEGVKLPDSVEVSIPAYYEILPLSGNGKTGKVTITSPNVTTDSVRISSWPYDLHFEGDGEDEFSFDLNSAMPYNYKFKVEYGKKFTDYTDIKVLGDRLTISVKPTVINEETGAKAYVVEKGEVSAVEFYSNPVRDKQFMTYTSSSSVELFNVGTVKLARFTESGDQWIKATYNDGKGNVTEFQISVIVLKDSYEVTFDAKGGTFEPGVSTKTITAEFNKVIEEPTEVPTKSGKVLEGWYKESALTHKWDFSKDVVLADTTLYAKWVNEPEP